MAGRGRGVGRGQQQPQPFPSTGGRGGGRGPQQPQPFPSTGGRGVGRGQPQPQPFPSTGGRGVGRGQQQPQPFSSTGERGVGRGQQQPQPFPSTGRSGSTGLGQQQQQQQPSFPTGRGVPVAPQQQSANVLSRELEKTLTIGESSGVAPVSSKAVRLPQRPGFGTKGTKMRVRANHFLVAVADRDLHHYDVSISPEVLSKKVCRDIMNELVESFGTSHLGRRKFAYDGRKSVYTAGELPFQSKDFVVKLVDKESSRREKEFKVSIKFASKCDLHHLHQFLNREQHDAPHETIQCLDVVFRQRPSNIYGVVGRFFFSPQLGATGQLGNGLEYWKGFYQSLRPTQMGLSLNIDMSARGFFESISVSDYVQKYLNKDLSRPLSDQERLKLKRNLKGVRIEVNHTKTMRRHKISGFSNEPLQRLTFPVDATGKMISVVDYFRQTYKIVLKYPHLPAIQTGSDSKPSYLPMEICTIVPGQRFSKKLNERQVTELLRATCQRPGDRENSIMKMVGVNDYNNDEIVNGEFGIRVTPELVAIDARVLPPPKLQYHASGRESLVEPRVGQWNMLNKKMVAGASVDVWTCVCFSRNLDYDRFCRELIGMCCEKGMRFNPTPLVTPFAARPDHIEKTLEEIYEKSIQQKKVIQLLIVILPDMTGSYDLIKRVCETRLGIVSQCCQPRQASKFSKQYMENVALKINVKVGGKNSILESAKLNGHPYLCDMPTIVIGADVTHPSPGEDSSPSIAAVVASMDWPQVTKYRALVSAQGHRDEIIQDLYSIKEDPRKGKIASGMIRDHIMAFYRNTRQKPLRIIFYRDGVSEGQFSQVLLHEVDAIRRACVSIEETYLPRITFVVVQKRHHTRLFPDKHGDRYSTDKSGNILPGTVVDTKICHPTEFDFYLCSHAGIQGTSRPAHYHVLYDENKFTADGIQMLTNNLCYTYARCTRSVSIVPPAYYAHLAAARARCYISERNFYSDSESAQGGAAGGGATRERTAVVPQLPEVCPNVTEVMFYC